MGGGDVGVWHVWGEDGGVGREVTGAGGVVGGTSRATESPTTLVDFAFFKNLASARRLEEWELQSSTCMQPQWFIQYKYIQMRPSKVQASSRG